MRTSVVAAGALALAILPVALAGQRPLSGNTVRVRPNVVETQATADWMEVSVIRLAGDTLWYASPTGAPAALLFTENEVRLGKNHRTLGIVLGGLIGVGVGAGVAYSTFEPEYEYETTFGDIFRCAITVCDEPSQTQTQVNSRSENTLVGAQIGVGLGVGLGLLVGRSIWSWTSVDVTQLTASAGGFAIGLRYRFPRVQ